MTGKHASLRKVLCFQELYQSGSTASLQRASLSPSVTAGAQLSVSHIEAGKEGALSTDLFTMFMLNLADLGFYLLHSFIPSVHPSVAHAHLLLYKRCLVNREAEQ